VAYGIPECQPNTDRKSRQKHDLDLLLKHLSEINSEINPSIFKDIYRLGKFKNNSSKPRPLLVKFLRSADVDYVLSTKSKLKSKLFLKPDLTPEERAKESLLLKERWSLIQKGVESKQIKMRNYSIFINNQQHCKLVGTQLEYQSTKPSLPAVSTSEGTTSQSS